MKKITPEQADKVKEGMDLWRGKDEPVKPESKTKTGARYIPKPENSGHGFSEGGDFEKFSLLKHIETTATGSTDKPESPKEGEEKRILQQAKEYQKNLPSGKREHFTGYIDGATAELHNTSQSYNDYLNEKEAELQSLRDQLAVKEAEIAHYIAANSILCDSESEVKLANENNRLEIENRKLKEALRECIKYVGEGANMLQDTQATDIKKEFHTCINKAQKLLTLNP